MTTSLLLSPEELDRDELEIGGDRYRHLFRARRQRVGDRIRVVDGQGRARWARVARVDRKVACLELVEDAPGNEPEIWLELFVVPPKPQRLTWLVEKSTEVGVSAIRLIHSTRGPRSYGAGTLDRLRRVASAAVVQSHRSLVPEISGVHDWQELAALTSKAEFSWTLDPSAERSPETQVAGPASLLVGPEGGWDEQERKDMEAIGCLALALGPRILRTETAAVVGSALLLNAGRQGV
jgi:16S rRNA (uracil1498-N3)-methyltransferase